MNADKIPSAFIHVYRLTSNTVQLGFLIARNEAIAVSIFQNVLPSWLSYSKRIAPTSAVKKNSNLIPIFRIVTATLFVGCVAINNPSIKTNNLIATHLISPYAWVKSVKRDQTLWKTYTAIAARVRSQWHKMLTQAYGLIPICKIHAIVA